MNFNGAFSSRNQCIEKKCSKIAYYGTDKPLYCENHRKNDINCFTRNSNKKCKNDFCYRPVKRDNYCRSHFKNPNIKNPVSVFNRSCLTAGCENFPTHTNFNSRYARYCAKHASLDMVHVVKALCKYPLCDIPASYNYHGLTKECCKNHKDPFMVNVLRSRCVENCQKTPSYNYPGHKAKYCFEHRKSDMINVVNKSCDVDGCKKVKTHGFRHGRLQTCKQHATQDMIDLKHNTCRVCNKRLYTKKVSSENNNFDICKKCDL